MRQFAVRESNSLVQKLRGVIGRLRGRLGARFSDRAPGIALALLIEGLLVLMLMLSIVPAITPKPPVPMAAFDIDAEMPKPVVEPPARAKASAAPAKAVTATEPLPAPAAAAPAAQPAAPAPVTPPQPAPTPDVTPQKFDFMRLSKNDMAAAALSPSAKPAARGPVMGPTNPGGRASAFADTPRVDGHGPNGEPLYAAAWYREPYDSELRGYLSTAKGPGWGLIMCRTVREYRVEDCRGIDEYPDGSGMLRAVLAAAWQFKVKPPRLRGQLKYGEWVRIRIEYGVRGR